MVFSLVWGQLPKKRRKKKRRIVFVNDVNGYGPVKGGAVYYSKRKKDVFIAYVRENGFTFTFTCSVKNPIGRVCLRACYRNPLKSLDPLTQVPLL